MQRFTQRKNEYMNAYIKLKEALKEKESEIVIDGALHRFEFTFELAWKSLKDYLEYMGLIEKTGSPRETIQQAFKQGIIEDGEEWINMMLSRNAISHMYDEKISRDIFYEIKNKFINLLEKLYKKYENL